jgi:NADPH:quinone reductase
MRAVTVSRFVSPHVLVIRDVPEPRASPGGVVVAIEAISVLWVETLIRPGCAGEYFDVTPPYVPGNAVVGVVREVGPDLDPGWAGRSVVARLDNGPWVRPASRDRGRDAGPVPDGIDARAAAALSHDGVTALALARSCGGRRASPLTTRWAGLGITSTRAAPTAGSGRGASGPAVG